MHCSRCGLCCQNTQMLLCKADIQRLESLGYPRETFARSDKAGYTKLRNHQKLCMFYDPLKKECKVYSHRPEGCRSYPVIYDEMKGIVVDDICMEKDTITMHEKAVRGLKVIKLLKKIDSEATKLPS